MNEIKVRTWGGLRGRVSDHRVEGPFLNPGKVISADAPRSGTTFTAGKPTVMCQECKKPVTMDDILGNLS